MFDKGEGKKTNSSSSGSLNAILQQLLNQGGGYLIYKRVWLSKRTL